MRKLQFNLGDKPDLALRVARDTLGRIVNPLHLPEWLPELRNREVLRADLIAGITVALILIPQSMAYAQLAGLPAHYGLYASLMPPMIAAFFGSSRQLATGPVAMVSLMTAAALEPLATAGGDGFIGYALLLSLMVGLFQLMMGMFRLGVLLNFLSHPVVLGFVNAAAIIIATSQLGKIFGVSVESGGNHIGYVLATLDEALNHPHWPTLGMAVLAFGIMYGVRRYDDRLPFVLIAVVVTTLLAWAMGFEQHRTVKLDQISEQKLRISLMYDALQSQHIANQEEKLFELQQAYDESSQGVTEENAELLAQRQVLEQTQFLVDQLREQADQHHEDLFATPLYAVGEGDEMKLFTREELAAAGDEDGTTFGQDWHILSYDNNEVRLQAGGQVVGSIPSGLPGFRLPPFDWDAIRHLISAALAISIIGFMEAISIARAIAANTRQHLNADRELIGQGVGNIAGSLFQAYPASGSFSRSAVNFNAGARTGFASVVTVLVVAVTLLFLTPLLYYLPQATLAAVIMMAVVGLINVRPLLHAWRTNRQDGVVALVTFVFTLALAPDLAMGIMLGIVLSLALLLFRIMTPRVSFTPSSAGRQAAKPASGDDELSDRNIVRMRFEGPLVFVSVGFFEDQLQQALSSNSDLKALIIDGVSINDVDASGEQMLRDIYQRLSDAGVEVLFTRFKSPLMRVFRNSRLYGDIEPSRFHRTRTSAYEHAWSLLAEPSSSADQG